MPVIREVIFEEELNTCCNSSRMSSFHLFLILTCMFCKTVVAQVSINASRLSPTDGQDVLLTCTLTPFTLLASWINNSTGGIMTSCPSSGTCTTTTSGRYNFSATALTIVAGISKYNATVDNFGWKCWHNTNSAVYIFTSATTATSTTTSSTICALQSFIGLALGDGLGSDTICIFCLIFIMILVKTVNIQDKNELQKPQLEGSVLTITAYVHGFCISSVQWIGPHGNILTSNGKYKIKYSRKTGKSTLQISALQINDSGLYMCRAKGVCGSSAQDSVRITAYEKFAVDIDIGETCRQHGSDVKFICSVYGSENKSVGWIGPKENVLTDGGRYNIVHNSDSSKSSLTITTSSITNVECYICEVVFKEVSVKIYITITVLDKGSLGVRIEKIILFVPGSENVSREWIGPQGTLTNTENHTIVPYDSTTKKSQLTINSFSANDNGSFTCQHKKSSESSQKYSITITTNDTTNRKKDANKLILGLGFGIICLDYIACIVILVTIGEPCALKFAIGLGLGLGIPFVGSIIVIVILFKKVLKPPQAHENRQIKSGSRSDVSRRDVEIQMEEKGVKSNEERPLVIDNRIGNKDESEIEYVLSKPFDPKGRRPLPPLNKELKDKPNHRPQPIPSEKNDVKDQNRRGLSANFEDSLGLASETPRPRKLLPIQHEVQSTVQEEDTLEEPKKNKKNRKKKNKTDEGKPADEIAK